MTLFTFIIFNVVGGDPSYLLAGKNATAERIETLRQSLGLDQSLLKQYLYFLKQAATFDWGQSWQTNENINSMMLAGLGPSLSLTLPAFLISAFLAIGLALFSAAIHNRKPSMDRSILVFCLSLMSVSFLVYIISFQYFFAFKLGLFQINGWESSWDGRWQYLFLPWIISITVTFGPNTLIFRSAFLEEVQQDYVRTAKAKGLNQFSLFTRHVLKNALIPIVTILIIQIPFLMTGSLLLESFFGIPGVGGMLIKALQNSDFPVVKAFTVVGSLLYMIFYLLSDILYTLIDPRVRLQ